MQNIADPKEVPEMEDLQYMNLCKVWSMEMIINSSDPTSHLPKLASGPEPWHLFKASQNSREERELQI